MMFLLISPLTCFSSVMASPDKYPKTTDSTSIDEELPPYPGFTQSDNMIPETSQQSLDDAGYISQEREEDAMENFINDVIERGDGEIPRNDSTEMSEMTTYENGREMSENNKVDVGVDEAEEQNITVDSELESYKLIDYGEKKDEKTAEEIVENAEFMDEDKSVWNAPETQDFQHPKSMNTVVQSRE